MTIPFEIYCNICGKKFKLVSIGGVYWGRSEKCCSKICLDEYKRKIKLTNSIKDVDGF